MNAIGIDFAEYASYVWLDRANPTLHMRKVRWNDIQADFVIRRISDGILRDEGYANDPHLFRAERTYLMGAYMVLYPQANMLPQVGRALEMWQLRDGDWDQPPWIDCEVKGKSANASARWMDINNFCCAIEDGIGKQVGVYTRKDWWEANTKPPSDKELGWITSRPLWLARATAYLSRDACPRDWWTHLIWQKVFNARARGVSGDVDINEWNGSVEEMRVYSAKWLGGQ